MTRPFLTCLLALMLTPAQARETAQTLFDRLRPSVVEVTMESRANLGVTSAASGFVTHRRDWVVTNYHAVTEAIFEPETHALNVETADGEVHAVEIIAVDVLHDLAILRVERLLDAPLLKLNETPPAKGESGYSMGKPGSYQHSIVSGTFNGMADKSGTRQIVFSGAINSGMSGGPVLDTQGQVVGVNVAHSVRHQLVGLAVPAQAVAELIRRSQGQNPPDMATLRADIARQLTDYGRQVVQNMDQPKHSLRRIGPFRVQGDLGGTSTCSTTTDNKPDERYRRLTQRCSNGDGVYAMDSQQAARIVTGAIWIQGHSLSERSMARVLERELLRLRDIKEEDSPPGRWHCTEQRLRAAHDLPVQLHACRRPVQKLPGLFDYRFRYLPLITGQDALVVAVRLSGFDDGTARAVLRKSLDRLRHTPEVQP